jgi:hypothetical protein
MRADPVCVAAALDSVTMNMDRSMVISNTGSDSLSLRFAPCALPYSSSMNFNFSMVASSTPRSSARYLATEPCDSFNSSNIASK